MEIILALGVVVASGVYFGFKIKDIMDKPKNITKAVTLLQEKNLMGVEIPFLKADVFRHTMVRTYRLSKDDVVIEIQMYGAMTPDNMKGILMSPDLFSNNTPSIWVSYKQEKVYRHG